MLSGQKFALIVACAAVAFPSAAFAQGAGDDQYVDPLAGLTGSNGTSTPSKPSKPKRSSGGSSSDAASAPVTATATTATTASEPAKATVKPRDQTRATIKRPAIDVNGLSGIGSLVAVPVKHVTLVIGDIAHGRG